MRVHIGNKASFLILMLLSSFASAATYTKTVSMPPAASVVSSGTPNLAANILSVGMPGVELIPSGSSESRAVANVTKGLRIPTSGIANVLKTGLRANAGSLIAGAAVSGLLAGIDWVMTDGVLTKKSAGLPTSYDGGPTTRYFMNPRSSVKYGSASEACDSYSASYKGSKGTVSADGSDFMCKVFNDQGQGIQETYLSQGGSTCPGGAQYSSAVGACIGSGAPVPLADSDYDLLDGFVKGKDGVWQRGLVDELCKGAPSYDLCVSGMGSSPYVSGPLSVSSPEVTTSSTSTNSDGSSTQVSTKTKTDYALSYPSSSPGTISIDPKTTTTTTTTTRDSTGQITGTNTTTGETTTTQPGNGTEIADGTFTDTPFPKVDPFYTQKFPGGFKDVWNNNKAAFDASPFISFLHSFVPSFSGSCPSWAMSFDIMPYAHFGSRQFSSLCSIFAVIKVIMLVTAMFTCRAIIFGG